MYRISKETRQSKAYQEGYEQARLESIIKNNFSIDGGQCSCNICGKTYSIYKTGWIIKHSVKHEIELLTHRS